MKTMIISRLLSALAIGSIAVGCATSERVARRTGETGARVVHHTGEFGERVVHGTGRAVAHVGHGIEHVGEEIAD